MATIEVTASQLAMAMLRAQGADQADIAKQLGVSQSSVSRGLLVAKDAGVLKYRIELDTADVRAEVVEGANSMLAPPSLVQGLLEAHVKAAAVGKQGLDHARPAHPVAVKVIKIPAQDRTHARGHEEHLTHFGRLVAPYVLSLLDKSVRLLGLTWGHQLETIVCGMERLSGELRIHPELQVVPLAGDPLLVRDPASRYSSSVLAERMRRTLHLDEGRSLSLAMLPAFLPGDITEEEREVVWKLVGKMHAYSRIFGVRRSRAERQSPPAGGGDELVSQLDMILTSASPKERPLGDGRGPLFESMKIDEGEFQRMALADIGGVLIEQPELTPPDRLKLEHVRDLWTGLREEEMLRCARRANSGLVPGVVLVATGASKAETVLAAIRRGLVNRLVICDELETALVDALTGS